METGDPAGPPVAETAVVAKTLRRSALQGALAGGGVGLLGADIIDLFGGDASALGGWCLAIVSGVATGLTIGLRWGRRGQPIDPGNLVTAPIRGRKVPVAWQLLGTCLLTEGFMGLTVPVADRGLAVTVWLIPVLLAGSLALLIPTALAFLRFGRLSRTDETTD